MNSRKLLLNLTAIALLASPSLAMAELWQGTIGKLPVVVHIDGDKQVDGQYFYRKHLRDLPLEGSREADGRLHLQVKTRDGTVTERWELRAKGKELSGEWQGGSRKLPIQLQRVDLAALRAGKDGERYRRGGKVDDYTALLLSYLELQPGKRVGFSGHELQWWSEPRSGMQLFTVESGYDPATLARINPILRERLWRSVADALQCVSAENGEFELAVTPHFMDARFLSVSLMSSYYCGGAHPDFGDSPLNLDVRNGRELALEDVLWLGKGTPPRESSDYDDPSYKRLRDYRSETLAPWIIASLKKLHPKDMAAPNDDDSCDYTDAGVWDSPTWHLQAEGVYVGPYFARVMRACEYPEWSVIPWKQVQAHPGPALSR